MHFRHVPIREQFTTSDGVKLSCLRSGPRTAQPSLLLVPGWCMPASIWAPQLDMLATDRAVLALDPRGQGESAMPDHGYDISRRARDLYEFALEHAPVIVVGWSLAALETLHAIHLFGSVPFSAVVLVDSSVGEEPAPPQVDTDSFRARLHSDRALAVEDFVRGVFRRPPPEPEIRALIDGALRLPLAHSLSLFPRELPRTHWRDIVRALRLPLLYAVTEQYLEQAGNLRLNRPGTRIEVFPNAGHALFVDQADRFNRLLARFAQEASAR